MHFSEWEPVYLSILDDMGYDRRDDEASARMLKAMTPNFDMVDDDHVSEVIGPEVTVFGASDGLPGKLSSSTFKGTLISAGSATAAVIGAGMTPDIVVTDLDGDV
jgi:2-amino-4-hydroxy-6-hydroxymethyldihydropteridine diphosphokinase